MTTNELSRELETIAADHDLDLVATPSATGSIWTTPDWTEWSDDMLAEVRDIARLRKGPQGDYWVAK